MGALHEGHLALLRRAREMAGPEGEAVVSIFVNRSSSRRARTSASTRAP
jgi:pantothenate synthetase